MEVEIEKHEQTEETEQTKQTEQKQETQLSVIDKQLLLEQLIPFFDNSKHFEILKMMISKNNMPKKRDAVPEILNDNKPIPLRIIDHTCTRFACEREAYCTILTHTGEVVQKRMKSRYDSKLKQHSKKRFDVYKRKYPNYGILAIEFKNGEVIETTLGQLNFFKWAISEGVLDFIRKNYDKIIKHLKEQKNTKTKKRQRALQQTFVYPTTDGGHVVDFAFF